MFPGLLRYDEAASGEIRHAIRFTVPRAQRAYVAPARHLGTRQTPACLPYGARLRLKASVSEAPYHGAALAIVRALKRYGMIFADQGSAIYLSGTSDPRWEPTLEAINQQHPITGDSFEVVRLPVDHPRLEALRPAVRRLLTPSRNAHPARLPRVSITGSASLGSDPRTFHAMKARGSRDLYMLARWSCRTARERTRRGTRGRDYVISIASPN